MSRVMMCHCEVADAQAVGGDEIVNCEDSESMLEEVALHPPDVVVYGLRPDSQSDLAVLRLFRRVAPRTPLVVVGEETTPWETPADLAPLYRAAQPDRARLRDTVRSALLHL